MGNKERIMEWINHKNGTDYIKLMRFCEEPRDFRAMTDRKKSGMTIRQDQLFKIIKDLKDAEGLEFIGNGLYKTTALGIECCKEVS